MKFDDSKNFIEFLQGDFDFKIDPANNKKYYKHVTESRYKRYTNIWVAFPVEYGFTVGFKYGTRRNRAAYEFNYPK